MPEVREIKRTAHKNDSSAFTGLPEAFYCRQGGFSDFFDDDVNETIEGYLSEPGNYSPEQELLILRRLSLGTSWEQPGVRDSEGVYLDIVSRDGSLYNEADFVTEFLVEPTARLDSVHHGMAAAVCMRRYNLSEVEEGVVRYPKFEYLGGDADKHARILSGLVDDWYFGER